MSEEVKEPREIISALIRGINIWANDEDGIHPDCEAAYQAAKNYLRHPAESWIAVEERLPEKDGVYSFWDTERQYAREWYFNVGDKLLPKYSHWMPLIQPPNPPTKGVG